MSPTSRFGEQDPAVHAAEKNASGSGFFFCVRAREWAWNRKNSAVSGRPLFFAIGLGNDPRRGATGSANRDKKQKTKNKRKDKERREIV